MMRSLFNGVSGLSNHQTRMDVISNNLANINTVGFKKSAVQFRDVWYDTLAGAPPMREGQAGINPKQVGLGSSIASTTTIFTQGSSERTNRDLDMSISGNGFYVMKRGATTRYTRAGSFVLDANGVLSDPASGFKVQGWKGANGRVEAMGQIEDIVIPMALKKEARATSSVEYKCNLQENHGPNFGDLDMETMTPLQKCWIVEDNSGNTGDIFVQYVKTGADSWSWTISDKNGGSFSETTGVLTMDNDGNIVTSQTTSGAPLTFTPFSSAVPSTANAITINQPVAGTNVLDDPASFTYSVSAGGNADPFRATYMRDYHDVATTMYDSLGTRHDMMIRYERTAPVGNIDTWTWNVTDVTDVDPTVAVPFQGSGTIQFAQDGRFMNMVTNQAITIQPNNAASTMTITPDMHGVTQFDSQYTTQSVDQNGFPMGVMKSLSVDEMGFVKVTYSNGVTDPYARIALKVFINPSGLSKTGDTMFAETFNSGEGMIQAPQTNSAGAILSGTLEMSNVDLAEEFTNMITTQRGFQANTRVITTSDEMLTDLIGLKR